MKSLCLLLLISLFVGLPVRQTLCDRISVDKDVDVLIIGAGASGVAAATRLLENNFTDFVVLEGQDRIGGRVHSVPFGLIAGGDKVDLGAEWVHGKTNNPVFEMASSLGLVFTKNDYDNEQMVLKSDNTPINDEMADLGMELMDHHAYEEPPEGVELNMSSYGEYLTSKYWTTMKPLIVAGNVTRKDAEEFLNWLEKPFNSFDGSSSWFDTSLNRDFEFVDNREDFGIVWKSGFSYSTIFDLLKKKIPCAKDELPLSDKLLLKKEVTLVEWSGSHAVVSCADGSRYKAKRVIVTVSLAVLKERAASMFQPNLPESKLKAIEGLGIDVIDKICLEFPYRWWPLNKVGIDLVWTSEDIAQLPSDAKWIKEVFGFYQLDRLPLTGLCGWIGGPAAVAMESQSDEEVIKQSMWVLRKFNGPSVNIPEPVSIRRSKWGTNPFIRGSYSFHHVKAAKLGVVAKDLAKPVSNPSGTEILLFAGEATHDKHYSTVHGAVKSGWREADRILRSKNNAI